MGCGWGRWCSRLTVWDSQSLAVILTAYDVPAMHSEVARWLEHEFDDHTLCTRVQKCLMVIEFIEDLTAEDAMRRFLKFWRAPEARENFAFFDLSSGTHAIAGLVTWQLAEFADGEALPVVRLADATSSAVPLSARDR